jgi:hypothetical protein
VVRAIPGTAPGLPALSATAGLDTRPLHTW